MIYVIPVIYISPEDIRVLFILMVCVLELLVFIIPVKEESRMVEFKLITRGFMVVIIMLLVFDLMSIYL